MTRKKRLQWNAGVIALALGGLTVDKLLLSEGRGVGLEPAHGAELAEGSLDLGAGPVAPGANTEDPALADDFGERLAQYDTVDPKRDPFQLSEVMLAVVRAAAPEEDEPEEKPETPELQSRATFQSSHRLEAVLVSGAASLAVVNGLTVRLGERVDDFVLVAVGDRSASFERGAARVTLTLPLE